MSRPTQKSSALDKSFAILDLIASSSRPLSAVELGLETGFNRQTVHRLLAQLEQLQLVQRDLDRQRFRVGVHFREIAFAGLSSIAASRAIKTRLESLVSDVRETCNIGVLDGHEVTYIERVECDWPLRAQFSAGSRVPAYCTAIGKLLLANADAKFLDHYLNTGPMIELTKNTIVETTRFHAEMVEIRGQGYSINNQEDFVGLIAIAVPIFNSEKTVVAGLAVHGPEARLNVQQAKHLVPELRKTADAIGHDLFA